MKVTARQEIGLCRLFPRLKTAHLLIHYYQPLLRLSPSSTIIWIILSRNWDEAEFVIGNCLAFLRFSRSGMIINLMNPTACLFFSVIGGYSRPHGGCQVNGPKVNRMKI